MTKPQITRTYGPIHFEDLDPHRFEDLIRELIYEFKDWQTIEATGRSGSDDGFDVRAYEKGEVVSTDETENDEEVKQVHPMEGNLWMVQGKREKEIGPQKIKKILADVSQKNPPYGYILAASANFSKESYDVFRGELRKKGVMEFYIWGKAELEDMLHLPKNDRILFTFFGISLVSKRKTRTTEIRASVGIKNKLFRVVGEGYQINHSILVRDLKDTKYPHEKGYRDFDTNPRWKEYTAFGHHPLGLLCHTHKYFAYIDTIKKEWDFTKEIDLVFRQRENEDDRQKTFGKQNLINDFWDFFPRKNKGYFIINGLIRYADIAIVDDRGDVRYDFPHLYVDFVGSAGPFAGFQEILKIEGENAEKTNLTEKYNRINIFPEKIKKQKIGKIYKNKKIVFNAESQKEFENYRLDTIYEVDGKYDFLEARDVIHVENPEKGDVDMIQITHKFKTKIKIPTTQTAESHKIKRSIELQLGRALINGEEINVYEFRRTSKWKLEQE